MKKVCLNLCRAVFLSLSLVLSLSCSDRLGKGAFLCLSFSDEYDYPALSRMSADLVKSGMMLALPDTNDFILKIVSEEGRVLYEGPYGKKPEVLEVDPGTYEVSVSSIVFDKPAFDCPQFGDVRTAVVNSGESLAVSFACMQLNCGMKLIFENSYISRFHTGITCLSSGGSSLEYYLNERRTAFFRPGVVKIQYVHDGTERLLASRSLKAADMMTIRLSASSEGPHGFSLMVDTSRNWIAEDYLVGSENDGEIKEKALRTDELSAYLGAKGVWAVGYIVGGDVSSSKMKFVPPFSKESHLAFSINQNASKREECAAVELSSSGTIRESLSLVRHPDLLGRRLYVKGTVTEYFGHPGIKDVKEFVLE